ncbi:MAG TPA: DUF1080 domain-containing protein [Cyclobacteriaceae bacterium]|jgi:hypothetical protein|nr:DUF1080 domain-containing protein [Cytophagales bacterium]HMR56411.1 DUF1080 domain-containing protein [Cyclobacteriaceae bacterium]HRE66068.1 DUF1080 domain-containing protein [Cyclobacteriaceae bacterium]HRF32241.1 DUF1080 domain-containing protein [Cyclobacteriaceae bacterium]
MKFTFIVTLCLISVLSMAQIPKGFKPLFNGKNLKGWHASRTTHQGTTPNFYVEDGAIVASQEPFGQGGILLTNQSFRDFELYMEIKIDSFSNGGIFLRSNEGGAAYQIELVLPGNTGNLLGERIPVSTPGKADKLNEVWKAGDWNSFRIRMTGQVPLITLWINDVEMYSVQQTKNDFIAQATEGMLALQCHWTAVYSPAASGGMPLSSWVPGARHRYKNIAIKKL